MMSNLCFKLRSLLLIVAMTVSVSILAQTNEKITLDFKGEHLTTVLRKIEKQTHYNFIFSYDDVSSYVVTGSVKNRQIRDVMDYLLKGKPLKYTIDGRIVSITSKKGASDKKREIRGQVVFGDDGSPVIGATVAIAGTDHVTTTNEKGWFSFPAYIDGGSVRVSYVGMETAALPVQEMMKFSLVDDTRTIDEVVVTGIFQKAKESYTGAVSTITKDQLEMYRGKNLMQTLKNIDASINFPVNNVAGSNPNVLPNLNIRGSSSLPMSVEEFNQNASQVINAPLIILDGFEISLTKLMDYNDEQIDRINILKDAAATAIYGSRGANGVVVIVTKQPQKGKLRASVRAGVSLEMPDLTSYDLLNAADKLQLEKVAGLYDDPSSVSKQYFLDSYYNSRLKAVKEGTDVDWMAKPLHVGVGQRYSAQLDGGSDEFRWSAALGYNGITGAMKGSNRNTINGDITLMYSVKNLIFRNHTSITSNNSNESPYGSFQDYVDQQPYNSPYDANGNLVEYFWDLDHVTKVGNPLYNATLNTIDKSHYLNVMNNFSIEWVIAEGLRMRGAFSVTTNNASTDKYLPPSHSTFKTSEYETEAGKLRRGRYTYSNSTSDTYSGQLTLSYSRLFAEKHLMYVGANYNIIETNSKNYGFTAEGFATDELSSVGNAMQYQQNGSPVGAHSTNRMVSITGNANYTYDNRYFIDLNYRTDGNSKFGADNRFAPFWSTGIGWNVTNEHFLPANDILSQLRLKMSYGLTGSQNITTESIYTTYQYQSGNRYIGWTAATLMGLGNRNLTWQKTREFNFGVEYGLFKNRIRGQFDIYNKRTENLLSSMDLPLSTGFPSYTSNVGKLSNVGFETSLNAYIIRDHKRKMNLILNAQFVYDKNEIIELSDAILEQNNKYMEQNVEVSNLFYVGKPLNAIYAVQSKGIDPSTGEELYIDRNGNITTEWNAKDAVYQGTSQPLYRGNIGSTFMWKNLTFNISFAYHFGGKTYNNTLKNRVEVSKSVIAQKNVDSRVFYDRWKTPGDMVFFRNFNDAYSSHATSRYVFDDRVLELSSINVQYRWNSKWLQAHSPMESVLFALNMSDIAHWSSVKYERGTGYPYARNIQGTVTLNF